MTSRWKSSATWFYLCVNSISLQISIEGGIYFSPCVFFLIVYFICNECLSFFPSHKSFFSKSNSLMYYLSTIKGTYFKCEPLWILANFYQLKQDIECFLHSLHPHTSPWPLLSCFLSLCIRFVFSGISLRWYSIIYTAFVTSCFCSTYFWGLAIPLCVSVLHFVFFHS